jgi:hypothetical protein
LATANTNNKDGSKPQKRCYGHGSQTPQFGFDTQLVTDANRQNLVSAVRTFREKAKGSQTVALFFYAGHGVQVNGENYLGAC